MRILWDEHKREANINKHGFDFVDLSEEFFVNAVIVPANDNRSMAIGRLRDGTIAVVFGFLGTEGISVISMRVANRKERKVRE
jgi:uncharacterized DUF497 family protein